MLEFFRLLDKIIVSLGLLVTFGLIAKLGLHLNSTINLAIDVMVFSVASVFIFQEFYRLLSYHAKWQYLKDRWLDFSIVSFMTILVLWNFIFNVTENSYNFTLIGLGSLLLIGLFSAMVDRVESKVTTSRVILRPSQVFILSFLVPIIIGGTLLKMPKATIEGISWIDAFFVATSAISVTGLSPVDISLFTPFGQVIVLLLIQIGGLGIMTLSLAFASFIAGGLGVKDRIMISQMLSDGRVSEIKSLLYKICVFTFTIEAVGAAILYFSRAGLGQPFDLNLLWSSIFHSISAFCNAGFSIYSTGLSDNSLHSNYIFFIGIMLMITLGGIGFPTLTNIYSYLKSFFVRKYQLRVITTTSKVIFLMSFILISAGTLLLWLSEVTTHHMPQSTFDKLFQSLFWSITSRSAGFNSLPVETLSLEGVFIVIFLMWVGGAPMSTAGGIKVTTLFVSFANLKTQIFGLDRIETYGREIKNASILKAYAIITMSLAAIFIATIGLVYLEPKLNPIDLLFEVVSGFSNVGLSRGITPQLSDSSKSIIMFMMFVGRIGLITIFAAIVKPPQSLHYRYLKDDIMIQ
ncbi:MAG: TrkH family potassium uptake protein [Bdellovibrionia bacterium]